MSDPVSGSQEGSSEPDVSPSLCCLARRKRRRPTEPTRTQPHRACRVDTGVLREEAKPRAVRRKRSSVIFAVPDPVNEPAAKRHRDAFEIPRPPPRPPTPRPQRKLQYTTAARLINLLD